MIAALVLALGCLGYLLPRPKPMEHDSGSGARSGMSRRTIASFKSKEHDSDSGTRSGTLVVTSHNRAVLSLDPEASREPSGENDNA